VSGTMGIDQIVRVKDESGAHRPEKKSLGKRKNWETAQAYRDQERADREIQVGDGTFGKASQWSGKGRWAKGSQKYSRV